MLSCGISLMPIIASENVVGVLVGVERIVQYAMSSYPQKSKKISDCLQKAKCKCIRDT